MSSSQRAQLLRSFHAEGELLVLPNAWDPLSAALIARSGAKAIATTSAGVSWAMGFQDGSLADHDSARIGRSGMIDAVRRIVEVTELPVTADVEEGYGPGVDDVATTVEQVIAAGAVGINLEDTTTPGPAVHHDRGLNCGEGHRFSIRTTHATRLGNPHGNLCGQRPPHGDLRAGSRLVMSRLRSDPAKLSNVPVPRSSALPRTTAA